MSMHVLEECGVSVHKAEIDGLDAGKKRKRADNINIQVLDIHKSINDPRKRYKMQETIEEKKKLQLAMDTRRAEKLFMRYNSSISADLNNRHLKFRTAYIKLLINRRKYIASPAAKIETYQPNVYPTFALHTYLSKRTEAEFYACKGLDANQQETLNNLLNTYGVFELSAYESVLKQSSTVIEPCDVLELQPAVLAVDNYYRHIVLYALATKIHDNLLALFPALLALKNFILLAYAIRSDMGMKLLVICIHLIRLLEPLSELLNTQMPVDFYNVLLAQDGDNYYYTVDRIIKNMLECMHIEAEYALLNEIATCIRISRYAQFERDRCQNEFIHLQTVFLQNIIFLLDISTVQLILRHFCNKKSNSLYSCNACANQAYNYDFSDFEYYKDMLLKYCIINMGPRADKIYPYLLSKTEGVEGQEYLHYVHVIYRRLHNNIDITLEQFFKCFGNLFFMSEYCKAQLVTDRKNICYTPLKRFE